MKKNELKTVIDFKTFILMLLVSCVDNFKDKTGSYEKWEKYMLSRARNRGYAKMLINKKAF